MPIARTPPKRTRRHLLQAAGATLAGKLLTTAGSTQAASRRDFSFALIGDVPYFRGDLDRTRDVLAAIDPRCEFVIHVGDFKASTELCSNELYRERIALLQMASQPLVFVPGDNEWSDCMRPRAGGFRPFERLEFLRRNLFEPARVLGKGSLALEQQSVVQSEHAVPENLRWEIGGVMFVSLNRPGGVDLRKFTNEESDQLSVLYQANESWLRAAFVLAKLRRLRHMVVVSHANPHFENDHHLWRVRLKRDAHAKFRGLLADLTSSFDGEVLFLHGDTHWFQVNQPLRNRMGEEVSNLTRVESFGSPFSSSWVLIRANHDSSPFFSVSAQHVDNGKRP